jgi:hypothetical protein
MIGEHLITHRGTQYTLRLIPSRGCCSEILYVGYSAQFNSGRIKLYEDGDVVGYQLGGSILENKPQQVGGEETQGKRDGFENAGLDDIFPSAHHTICLLTGDSVGVVHQEHHASIREGRK